MNRNSQFQCTYDTNKSFQNNSLFFSKSWQWVTSGNVDTSRNNQRILLIRGYLNADRSRCHINSGDIEERQIVTANTAYIFELFKTHFSSRKYAHNLHQTFIGQLSSARDQNANSNHNCTFRKYIFSKETICVKCSLTLVLIPDNLIGNSCFCGEFD